MFNLGDIKKFSSEEFAIFGLAFLAIFSPGVVTIFHFYHDVVESCSTIKLLVLASSFNLPFLLINTFLCAILFEDEKSKDQEFIDMLAPALVVSPAPIFIALYASYLASLSFKYFTLIAIGVEVVFIILGCILLKLKN
ncbi:MAG: hypothetical protein EVA58_02250 [Kiritimatiellaceae bacterium]|nr:MAG: hypothetical protein EVA58_02250 [Kiritimatiellaceae bacterium]|tara:strand:- start:107 stop:520 length:414 start_codon:yes stop_codon:yes gene_type:complete